MRRVLVGALAAVLLASACSGGGGASKRATPTTVSAKKNPGLVSAGVGVGYTPTGPIIADNGFRPQKDGFSFENYGTNDPPDVANLGPEEMRKLFGDKVCSSISTGTCVLTPPAEQWLNELNKSTEGGHCEGLSVLSGMLWKGVERPATYGAPTTPALKLDGNQPLQREVAYAFAFQNLDAYNAAIITGAPHAILDKLIQVLRPDNPETYTLGIYQRGFVGGHAVTPFAVEDDGGGIAKVLIYDNNYPGVTRAITIDRNTDTWRYEASVNPRDQSDIYEGDAATQTIDLEPASPGEGVQPCPFCGNRTPSEGQQTSNQLDQVWLDGSGVDHAHLLITDPDGHHIGFVNGQFVNDMPGARAAFNKATQDWSEVIEPDYYVPDGVDYTITIDGAGLKEADDTTVGVIGPSFDATVDALTITPGEKSTFTVGANVTRVGFSSTGPQQPSIEVGWSGDVDYDITISGINLRPGGSYDIGLPDGVGDMILTGTSPGSLNFTFDRSDGNGTVTFTHNGIPLADGDSADFHYGAFTDPGDPVALDTTHGGSTSTQQVPNQQP